MNLIRNILFVVLLLQFLGFLYMKFIHKEETKNLKNTTSMLSTINQDELNSIVAVAVNTTIKKKPLPISTEYTDNQIKPQQPIIIKIAKIKKKPTKKVIKITKLIKKTKIIPKTHKKVKKIVSLSKKIETYAKKMLGKKYVWGAVGPKCYDCSGFTQRVYKKVAGIKLPRVSYLQAKVGKRISYNKLKSGDMVFFDTQKKKTGRVNHVGIYLKNGNFIHASSGGKKVMITNFNKKRFYKNRFLWGRRIINTRSIAMKVTKKTNTI